MIAIRAEIREVEEGRIDGNDNPLRTRRTTAMQMADAWAHDYSREKAAFPVPSLKRNANTGRRWRAWITCTGIGIWCVLVRR